MFHGAIQKKVARFYAPRYIKSNTVSE